MCKGFFCYRERAEHRVMDGLWVVDDDAAGHPNRSFNVYQFADGTTASGEVCPEEFAERRLVNEFSLEFKERLLGSYRFSLELGGSLSTDVARELSEELSRHAQELSAIAEAGDALVPRTNEIIQLLCTALADADVLRSIQTAPRDRDAPEVTRLGVRDMKATPLLSPIVQMSNALRDCQRPVLTKVAAAEGVIRKPTAARTELPKRARLGGAAG